ncbi:hypothetical protein MYCTH_2129567 [Thermothelomyces thermophilus ATCC 42464]|uniref:2EXR domain-containing protein n=1 Tax=Thermothelomyces thermophilus (strain ATCC 42464 / BCRC 31852 / DSM 1799) TaxID=573729 RepID=G2QMS7_THET4|nr:uncharacterized protein MYCTH_2129567 [Thermothelomyces thermophilus ATCC 42464]AEO60467.1 hypothetical protein MYCTH_2129567 [Thermothelomyces thermophilus ATCC 42464]
MTAATITTFYPLPRLPFEIRARIWELRVEPRIVEVVYYYPSPAKMTDPDAWAKGSMKSLPPVRHPPALVYRSSGPTANSERRRCSLHTFSTTARRCLSSTAPNSLISSSFSLDF